MNYSEFYIFVHVSGSHIEVVSENTSVFKFVPKYKNEIHFADTMITMIIFKELLNVKN